jgi:hypothetical protein
MFDEDGYQIEEIIQLAEETIQKLAEADCKKRKE